MYSHLDAIPECDGQTDKQTDEIAITMTRNKKGQQLEKLGEHRLECILSTTADRIAWQSTPGEHSAWYHARTCKLAGVTELSSISV